MRKAADARRRDEEGVKLTAIVLAGLGCGTGSEVTMVDKFPGVRDLELEVK